ncbi:MAG: hypothetical protein ABFS10_10230 [Bacteroidota bacterium]
MKKLLVLFAIVVLGSCSDEMMNPEELGQNAGIVGTWVEEISVALNAADDGSALYKRADEFDQEKPGFTINEDGTFIERKNAGWCATPPISYDNFEGTWVALSDSLLEITVGYWGGTLLYQMRIISVDQEKLRIRYLYADSLTESR